MRSLSTLVLLSMALAACGGDGAEPSDSGVDALIDGAEGDTSVGDGSPGGDDASPSDTPTEGDDTDGDGAIDQDAGEDATADATADAPDAVEDQWAPGDGGPSPCEGDASCDDGDPCTSDRCDAGSCAHDPMICDDDDPCTADLCSIPVGCSHPPLDCGDDDACTDEHCAPPVGCSYGPVACDDGDPCTVDACNANIGCFQVPLGCDDGDGCTTDTCDGGACAHTPSGVPGCCSSDADCIDADPCTQSTCAGGACVAEPTYCGDLDLCTVDWCEPHLGCAHAPDPCDDDDACTADTCHPVTGCAHLALGCDDGDACTADSCSMTAGCAHEALPCDDGNPCTTDGCSPATGLCTFGDGSCDDGDPCTLDQCTPGGCAHLEIDDPTCCVADADCDDGDPCTTSSCVANTCEQSPVPGPPCCAVHPLLLATFGALDMAGFTVDVDEAPGDGVTWAPSTEHAVSPSASLRLGDPVTGTYETGERVVVTAVSPEVALPHVAATLDLQVRLDTEFTAGTGTLDRDVLMVLVRDAGGTETLVWSSAEAPEPWWLEHADGSPAPGWAPLGPLSLSLWAEQSIRILLRFDSMDGEDNAHPGVWVDDLTITAPCPPGD
ncbi:MAG: hypothetical protein AMXMBFR64_52150 [Myxococcales bacterium]